MPSSYRYTAVTIPLQAQLQAALDQALEMPLAERDARAKKDMNHISTHTSEDWGTRFLVDLKSMKRKQVTIM